MDSLKTITCINCPLGCAVTITPGPEGPEASGNDCQRGETYALQEYNDPRRVLTGTVKVEGAFLPRLPVKTDGTLPKNEISAAAREMDRITVRAPVNCGDILVKDFVSEGVNLVATRRLDVRS